LLEELTGSTQQVYPGIEARYQIVFSSVTSSLKFYYYFAGEGQTKGISNGQLGGGISISAPLFKGVGKRYVSSN